MRILFVTATRVGDAVLSSGLLGWLLDRHPGARVTVACGAPAAPLFAGVPGLERVIVIEKRKRGLHWLELWAKTVGGLWDVVVDLRGSALGYFLLARRRKVLWLRNDSLHRVVEAGHLFALDPPPAPRPWFMPAHRAAAERLVSPGAPVLAIGPTANWGAKMWRAERFAELAQRLTAPGGALAGGRVAVFGGADEREAAQPVIAAIPEARRIDLVGRTDLPVAGACLERCALYVGNDSGLMHIAAAAGAPTVGLFGPSPEWRYAPWGAHTSVVRTAESHAQLTGHAGFDHRVQDTLMDSISVETVENAARELLARAAATGPSAAQGGRA